MEEVKEPISNESPENYPLLTERIQSTAIDAALIVISMFVIAMVLDRYERVPDWVRIGLFVGLVVVYEPLCTTLGFTVGNYIKGIRVRQFDNSDKKINFLQALLRYVFKLALGGISFLAIFFTKKRRAIHDMVAGSVMIKL
ncbi:RDD family protein [Niabella hibiscisoli]|uniref:RDD family protein n=1 Tax=Niabella hibiscisoli TaxID=1825928 RepID=UPI001F10BC29|nr:RDD family protein [Niabella hibiscisoli]MCH5715347.1 RDD family protein [Niabella hibiscisoli]